MAGGLIIKVVVVFVVSVLITPTDMWAFAWSAISVWWGNEGELFLLVLGVGGKSVSGFGLEMGFFWFCDLGWGGGLLVSKGF